MSDTNQPRADLSVFNTVPTLVRATERGAQAVDSCAIVWRCQSQAALDAILVTHQRNICERIARERLLDDSTQGCCFTYRVRNVHIIDLSIAPDFTRRTILCHESEAQHILATLFAGGGNDGR